jgi:putative DNA primase/helicase
LAHRVPGIAQPDQAVFREPQDYFAAAANASLGAALLAWCSMSRTARLLGLVEHVERGIVGIHRTYLRIDGTAKADIPRDWQKRALGPIGGGAVRLGMPQPGAWFAVGEGIETILSVMTACAVPGWAALSAGGLRALILPPEATHVVVCADNDLNGIGQRAAHDAAERWLFEGRRVRLAIPPDAGTDFNDLLCADAPAFTTGGLHVA